MTCTFGIGMLYSDISLFTYVEIVVYFLNTLTAKQIFEKLSFGSCEANCLLMFILTQNYVLN